MAGPIRIAILANAKPAVQSMRNVEQTATGMGSKLGGIGKGIAAGFATMGTALAAAGIAEGFKEVIGQAADLSAAVGATKQVFGDAASGMLDWSKTTATTLGLSQSEALNATKVFGGFFTAVGMGSKEAAGMSQSWATMAGNLAAFADLPTADAIDAITGALRGEMDPLQKYIPTVSAAAVAQKAMELSGKKNASALTQQDKAAALNALMMESVANKAGAAERAQGGYAVQMEKLKAQAKDAAASLGSVFLPALTGGMRFINETAIPAMKKFGEFIGPKLKGMLDGIGGFKPPKALIDVAQSEQVTSIVDKAKSGFMSLQPSISKALSTVTPILSAFGDTAGAMFSKAVPQIKAIFGTVGDIVGQVFATIKAQIDLWVSVVQFIWQNFGSNILAYVSTAFAAIVNVIQGVLNIVKGIFNVVIGLLTGDWAKAWDGVKGIVSGAWQAILGIFNLMKAGVTLLGQAIGKILSGAWSLIASAAVAAWNGIKNAIANAWSAIKSAISSAVSSLGSLVASGWNAVKSATVAAWEAVKSATTSAWNSIKAFFSGWWSGVKSLASSGGSAVQGAISAAWNAVKSATTAAWNGIKGAVTSGIGNVISTVKSLPGKVKSAVSGAAGWLVSVGRDMIWGLIAGIGQMASEVANKAKSVVSGAVNAAKSALGIASPSKVFMELGRLSVAGLIEGLETGKADLKKTTEGLIDAVVSAFPTSIKKTFAKGTKLSVIEAWKKKELAAGKARGVKRNALLDRIEKDNAKLQNLADKRDTAAENLKVKNEEIAAMQQARGDVVKAVAAGIVDSFKLVVDAGDEGIVSIDSILERSRTALAQAQEFAASLKTLAGKGISPEVLRELATAGPQAGLDTARALMAASADQLAELSKNYADIAATGQQAGEVVAGNMYDTGILAARKVAEGFASQQASLEATILQIVDSLTKKINAAVAAVTPKAPAVEQNKPITVAKPKAPAKSAGGKASPQKAVPAGPPVTAGAVTVTVNTGVVVDKRGMVDTISAAFNEVSTALGRPISMNVG